MKKLRLMIASIVALLAIGTTPVYAQGPLGGLLGGGGGSGSGSNSSSTCGNTKTQLIACKGKTGVEAIGDLIKITISVLTVLIGVVATGAIAYGALLYASAKDDQGKVNEAITIIRNTVIGILLYAFMIAIINWLVPGGVIG